MKQEQSEKWRETAASRMAEAAKLCKGMSEKEYLDIYRPFDSFNECCARCWNCGRGCRWHAEFREIPGWVAEATSGNKKRDSYKIFYCPQLKITGTLKRGSNGVWDGSLSSSAKPADGCSLNYRMLLEQILEYRKEYAAADSSWNTELARKYGKALKEMRGLETVLASHVTKEQRESVGYKDSELDRRALEESGG